MIEHVILLHGLWMRGFALAMLHRRMMEAGFRVHRFDYLSVANTQERILEQLHGRITELGEQAAAVHLVGHSLGGLLALEVCRAPALPGGRVVCLGSPLMGSAAAREFSGLGRSGEALLGHNRELLERGYECWDGPREVGMIAGRSPIGLGAVLAHIEGEHDGTVAVAETRLPGLADHCVVDTSHTGLLFSADVARLTARFLRSGRFADASMPATPSS
ncbi:esterase/lipase family protein [Dyella sp.]|jgi:pimeloyl-ACP methyl ester carboxylesterase|uniref:esterase/lipase family protein n=1 Tax=Dyella sp. TaxID=1869338 RepID=UPI002D78D7D0|nr:alpha/beta fold hydrolase [Dyella sp.]HET6433317.1 alpha/beta fold hydrolase [Dyella sp.]